MKSLEKIRTISRLFRALLIGAGTLMCGAVLIALAMGGQSWLSIGDPLLAGHLESGTISGPVVSALLSPVAVIFILGLYWLQRLFAVYARGEFFTNETMRCYLWLVWLKVASFIYHLALPVMLGVLAPIGEQADTDIVLDTGNLAELMVLLLIVHILREAQRINEENKGFV